MRSSSTEGAHAPRPRGRNAADDRAPNSEPGLTPPSSPGSPRFTGPSAEDLCKDDETAVGVCGHTRGGIYLLEGTTRGPAQDSISGHRHLTS